MIDVISFDLQGTLSDPAFSDEFWMETLPLLYAQNGNCSLEKAKEELKKRFIEYGKYDLRYYSTKYWIKELKQELGFEDIQRKIKNKPLLFKDILKLIRELLGKTKLIIISSTTHEFINTELGKHKIYFDKVYSSIDDFGIAGKPKELYTKIAKLLGISPSKIIHIGDDYEMDIQNAKEAGFKTFYFDKTQSREKLIESLRNHPTLQL